MSLGLLFVENGGYFKDVVSNRVPRSEFSFYTADQLGEAADIISEESIDVSLVDLSSLKREGVRIIKELKLVKPRIEIITINSYDQLKNSIEAMKVGVFDDFLIPVEINTLIERIRAAGQQKKIREKQARPLLQQWQDAMMAVAFAEVGELEMAKTMAEGQDQLKKSKKGD
jgi:DNA-binding NtrC family response regulator